MSSSNLPPRASQGVFTVSADILIDAPIEHVWNVLVDFGSYREWNPFVRDQTIVTSTRTPAADQTPTEGAYLLIGPVNLPPTMDDSKVRSPQTAFEQITAVDVVNHRIAWRSLMTSYKFIFEAERWQVLSVGEGGKTRYETVEVFSGALAYLVRIFVGSGLREGFQAMAEGLKKRAEETKG